MHITHFHQFEHYLDPVSRQIAFEQASKLLYEIFPKRHTGQRFTGKWNDCALYIQHVIILNTHYIEGEALSAPSEFATLMGWASWYVSAAAPSVLTIVITNPSQQGTSGRLLISKTSNESRVAG